MRATAKPLTEHRASYERIFEADGLRDEARFYRWILRLLRPSAGWRFLDVACGEGGVVVEGQRLGLTAYGLDISFAALERAQRIGAGPRVVVGNSEELPFASGVFDGVTCLGSVENFEDPVRALGEVRRVLSASGTLCVMMPNKFWLGDVLRVAAGREEQVPFQHVERVATLRQWQTFLELQGFAIVQVRGYVKRAPLFRRGRIRSVRKFLMSQCLAAVCPPGLAWSIVFVCRKAASGVRPVAQRAWLWRAEWAKNDSPC